jgi:hypothetical protein
MLVFSPPALYESDVIVLDGQFVLDGAFKQF